MRAGLVEGKVAMVTGAGSGIGAATAELLAEEGAAGVLVCDLDGDSAKQTAARIEQAGNNALALTVDVSKRAEVEAAVARCVEEFGRLDCAVNNAGMRGELAKLGDYEDATWEKVLAVNLDSVFYGMRAQIQAMRGRGGSIVNIASGTVALPTPGLGAYVASKSAIVGVTKSTAGEYSAENIRVNAVLPGRVATPMLLEYLHSEPGVYDRAIASAPMHRLAEPRELAEATVWLCSDRSSYVQGVALLVDGGQHAFSTVVHPTGWRLEDES